MNKLKNIVIFDFDGVIADTFEFCFDIMLSFENGLTKDDYKSRFEGNIFDALKKQKTIRVLCRSEMMNFFPIRTGAHAKRGV